MYKGLTSNQKYLIMILGIVVVGLSTTIGRFNSIDVISVSPQKKPLESLEIIASKPNKLDPTNYNSEDKLTEDYKPSTTIPRSKNNLNLSSISLDKTILWFCTGAFGYATVYAIGKSISDK